MKGGCAKNSHSIKDSHIDLIKVGPMVGVGKAGGRRRLKLISSGWRRRWWLWLWVEERRRDMKRKVEVEEEEEEERRSECKLVMRDRLTGTGMKLRGVKMMERRKKGGREKRKRHSERGREKQKRMR